MLLWQLASVALGERMLPAPLPVLALLVKELVSGDLLYHLGVTLARVAASFTLAMLAGTAIGILMGRYPRLDRFFDGWLVVLLNIPALVVIILAYIWFGLIEAAAVLAVVVNKIPNVVVTVREGARALDPNYLDMARVYRFDRLTLLRHVILPQLTPYLIAASRSGLALIWKIVLVVELLGRSNGMGFQLHLYFQLFDVAHILAYTIAFILVIQMIEWLIMKPMDRASARWRR